MAIPKWARTLIKGGVAVGLGSIGTILALNGTLDFETGSATSAKFPKKKRLLGIGAAGDPTEKKLYGVALATAAVGTALTGAYVAGKVFSALGAKKVADKVVPKLDKAVAAGK